MVIPFNELWKFELPKLKVKHKALLKKQGNAALGKIKQEWISFYRENPGVENISYHDYVNSLREEMSQE